MPRLSAGLCSGSPVDPSPKKPRYWLKWVLPRRILPRWSNHRGRSPRGARRRITGFATPRSTLVTDSRRAWRSRQVTRRCSSTTTRLRSVRCLVLAETEEERWGRRVERWVTRFLPLDVIANNDSSGMLAALCRCLPLRCAKCSLHYPAESRCPLRWSRLDWRPCAPEPTFYVRDNDCWGYLGRRLGSRRMRYAIDLSKSEVRGVQVTTHAASTRWVDAASYNLLDAIIWELEETDAAQLPAVLRGEPTHPDVHAGHFTFNKPAWCSHDSPRHPIRLGRPVHRSRLA